MESFVLEHLIKLGFAFLVFFGNASVGFLGLAITEFRSRKWRSFSSFKRCCQKNFLFSTKSYRNVDSASRLVILLAFGHIGVLIFPLITIPKSNRKKFIHSRTVRLVK